MDQEKKEVEILCALILILLNVYLTFFNNYFDIEKEYDVFHFFLEIYRQKLQQAVADGELSEEDVKSLERLQVMLCIRRETVEAVHKDICGRLFEKVHSFYICCTLCCVCVIICVINLKVLTRS